MPGLVGTGQLALRPCDAPFTAGMQWKRSLMGGTDLHATEWTVQGSDGAVLGQVKFKWQGLDPQSNERYQLAVLESLGMLQGSSTHLKDFDPTATTRTEVGDLQPLNASIGWQAFWKEPAITGLEVVVDVPALQKGADIAFAVLDEACAPTLPHSSQPGKNGSIARGLARCFFKYGEQMQYRFSLTGDGTFEEGDVLELAVFATHDVHNFIQDKVKLANHTCPLCGGACTLGAADGSRGAMFLNGFFPLPLTTPTCGRQMDISFTGKQNLPSPLQAGDAIRRAMVSSTDWEATLRKRDGRVVARVRVRAIPGNVLDTEQQQERFGNMQKQALQPVSSRASWADFSAETNQSVEKNHSIRKHRSGRR